MLKHYTTTLQLELCFQSLSTECYHQENRQNIWIQKHTELPTLYTTLGFRFSRLVENGMGFFSFMVSMFSNALNEIICSHPNKYYQCSKIDQPLQPAHFQNCNSTSNCCLRYMKLGRWGKQHSNTFKNTHTAFPTETEAWFICRQIKSTEEERVEKIIPGKQQRKA